MTPSDRLMAAEKTCPSCGCEAVAWIAGNDSAGWPSPDGSPLTEQYECRRCKTVFFYQPPLE